MKSKKVVTKVTACQQKLVDQLLITPKVKDAAERIGMSYTYARKVVTKPHVIQALLESHKRVSERAEIDAAFVLRGAVEVFERCMQDQPVLDSEGNPTGEYRFEHSGANKALEIIGKHRGVRAFTDEPDNPTVPTDTVWTVKVVHMTKADFDRREKCIEHIS
jgi:phage terminase small subunit